MRRSPEAPAGAAVLAASDKPARMSVMPWLRPAGCPLLQADSEADPLAVRLVQRLLELSLASKGADETARLLLEEILAALRADQAVVAEAAPNWSVRWQQTRR